MISQAVRDYVDSVTPDEWTDLSALIDDLELVKERDPEFVWAIGIDQDTYVLRARCGRETMFSSAVLDELMKSRWPSSCAIIRGDSHLLYVTLPTELFGSRSMS